MFHMVLLKKYIGDAAFPLRTYIMTPYSGRELVPEKLIHNRELSRGRCCIENAFGILSARWQIFLTSMSVTPENAKHIIMSAILLHNFIMMGDHQKYANAAFITAEWRQIVKKRSRQLRSLPSHMKMSARNATPEALSIREKVKDILKLTTP